MSQSTPSDTTAKPKRLPCRGCMPDCINYATCDGMPWRADKAAKVKLN